MLRKLVIAIAIKVTSIVVKLLYRQFEISVIVESNRTLFS